MQLINPRHVEREARKLGMTLQELSAKLEVPYSSLRRWARGEDSPKVEAWKTASGKIEKLKAKQRAPVPRPLKKQSLRPLTASEILKLPPAEQDRILRKAAKYASPLYRSGEIEIFEAFGEKDFFDETP